MFTPDKIKSIGHKKGLLLLKHFSEIIPRSDYLVVKTPANDKYISANFILFKDPPNELSVSEWPNIFKKEFGNNSNIRHIKLEWDKNARDDKILTKFINQGFSLEEYETLILDKLKQPPFFNEKFEIREINYARDWSKIVKQQMYFRPDTLSVEYYDDFSRKLMKFYERLINKGQCKWFGSYTTEGKLIGSLGILWSKELTGFQRIVVDPEYRKEGICSTLIYWVSNWILKNLPTDRIVIWAEKDSSPSKIYRACGYTFLEELLAINKYPEN